MDELRDITFVVPVSNEDIFNANFLSSPLIQENSSRIIVKKGYKSASIAYNEAIQECKTELMVFLHQDMILESNWIKKLHQNISYLDDRNIEWGVMGLFGANHSGEYLGNVYCSAYPGLLGGTFFYPMQVRVLDEIVLIIRKFSGLNFDCNCPGYHFYGTDICLSSEKKGFKNYVFSTNSVHNSKKVHLFPKEFINAYFYIRKKWYDILPVFTPCIKVERIPIVLLKKYVKQLVKKCGVL